MPAPDRSWRAPVASWKRPSQGWERLAAEARVRPRVGFGRRVDARPTEGLPTKIVVIGGNGLIGSSSSRGSATTDTSRSPRTSTRSLASR
jgi:hypothetical protein